MTDVGDTPVSVEPKDTKSQVPELKQVQTIQPAIEQNKANTKRKNGFRDIIRNIRQDSLYRQKFVHTCLLWWSFIGLGWIIGINGPTFPDLRLIINEDLSTASWLFPAGSLGYLVGSFIGGVLYDKFNKILLLALSSLCAGLTITVTPFCSTLPWMLAIKFAGGASCGAFDVGGNADIIFIWGLDGDSYMQALHFWFSFGASISPYVTEPFLARKIHSCPVSGNLSSNLSIIGPNNSMMYNESMTYVDELGTNNGNVTPEVTSHVTDCQEENERSSVHIAFILAGLIMFTSTIGFVYLYIKSKQTMTREHAGTVNKEPLDKKVNTEKFSKCTKVIFLVLLGIMTATYCVVEDGFANYFMTFAIEHLKWEKSTGSFATGLFWLSFGIGRFMGIFVIAYCQTTALLTSCLILLGCTFVGFLFSTLYHFHPLIWVFIAALGFSMSVVFPTIISWTSEHIIEVNGRISSYFLTFASLSVMLCMFLIGNLMDKYDPIWFIYIMVIITSVCLTSYIIICIVLRIHKSSRSDKTEAAENARKDCSEMKQML